VLGNKSSILGGESQDNKSGASMLTVRGCEEDETRPRKDRQGRRTSTKSTFERSTTNRGPMNKTAKENQCSVPCVRTVKNWQTGPTAQQVGLPTKKKHPKPKGTWSPTEGRSAPKKTSAPTEYRTPAQKNGPPEFDTGSVEWTAKDKPISETKKVEQAIQKRKKSYK
jgi:hypothetical protein